MQWADLLCKRPLKITAMSFQYLVGMKASTAEESSCYSRDFSCSTNTLFRGSMSQFLCCLMQSAFSALLKQQRNAKMRSVPQPFGWSAERSISVVACAIGSLPPALLLTFDLITPFAATACILVPLTCALGIGLLPPNDRISL